MKDLYVHNFTCPWCDNKWTELTDYRRIRDDVVCDECFDKLWAEYDAKEE